MRLPWLATISALWYREVIIPLDPIRLFLNRIIAHGNPDVVLDPAGKAKTITMLQTDLSADILPADMFTPTGPIDVVPFDSYFQMHAGCAFMRAPRRVEPNMTVAETAPHKL